MQDKVIGPFYYMIMSTYSLRLIAVIHIEHLEVDPLILMAF